MDLDGSDAFEHVFERALDLSKLMERQRNEMDAKDVVIAKLSADLHSVKAGINANARASANAAAYGEALIKLWEAASGAVKSSTDDGYVTTKEALMEAIAQTAEAKAKADLDMLPF